MKAVNELSKLYFYYDVANGINRVLCDIRLKKLEID